ncbi:MAG TPA: hypothetical protein VG370_27975, partial [Chloroflexota bacterium]|nr:hypothetical protein [Chloroflexota bacterium]
AVLRAAGELRAAVEEAGIPASPPRTGGGDGEEGEGDQIRIGLADGRFLRPAARADAAAAIAALRPDGYAWWIGAPGGARQATIWGKDDRGALFGTHDLIERVRLGRGWPNESSAARSPFFPVRRWSAAISRIGRRPWDDRRALWDGLARARRIMDLAPRYGVGSFELNGRPGDGFDPDWLLAYRHAPEFRSLRSVADSDDKLLLLEETGRRARERLLDLYVWSHELYVPPEFFVLFPETRGVDYSLCTSHPRVHRFIRDRYAELFEGAPSLGGVVISVNESGHFSLIVDRGCRCDQCRDMTRSERLLSVLSSAVETCQEYGKTIVLRTFQAAAIRDLDSHPDLEIVRQAFARVPRHVQMMSKYCPQDFYGTTIVDEPLIGAFDNPHLVEFSLDREWSGRTFVPALTPNDFQKRLRHARSKGVIGTVARVDFPFPEMEPEEIFTHPNEFNAYVFGKLSWDPDYDVERAWSDWGRLRYGDQAASDVTSALKRTEVATERIFFVRGLPVVNYHNMIAPLSMAIDNLWAKAPSKWDRGKRWLTDKLFHPDEAFIQEVIAETLEARDQAELALGELSSVRPHLDASDYVRLRDQLGVMREASVLWSHLNELFFRYMAWDDRTRLPDPEALSRSLGAAQGVIQQGLAMERRHGPFSWPVFSPDRGVSAYEFVEQVWITYLSAFLGTPIPTFERTRWVNSFTHSWSRRGPGFVRDGILGLWLDCFEAARGHLGKRTDGRTVELPPGLAALGYDRNTLQLVDANGGAFPLPIGMAIEGTGITAGERLTYAVRRLADELRVEATSNERSSPWHGSSRSS